MTDQEIIDNFSLRDQQLRNIRAMAIIQKQLKGRGGAKDLVME